MRNTCIALLSDFGHRDVYVGVMKGVITRIAPHVRLIDLTHEVPPGDVRHAAFRLWQAFSFLPEGTIFLAVVDPGVGTSRRPVAIQCTRFSCVGPDNGVFTYLIQNQSSARAVEISRREELLKGAERTTSSTFHGRDVFAPAAGLLAVGTDLSKLGPEANNLVKVSLPRLVHSDGETFVRGEALFADRFGNMATSIGALIPTGDTMRLEPWLPGCPKLTFPAPRARVRLGGGMELPLSRTFAEVRAGEPLAYIGSDRLLEIGVNQGSAVDALSLTSGTDVILTWR